MILGDELSPNANDIEKHLWNIRLKDTWDKWSGELKAGLPKPEVKISKTFQMAVLGLAAATGVFATDTPIDDIRDSFDWKTNTSYEQSEQAQELGLQIKAFVTPPTGIQIAPLYLDQDTKDENHGGDQLIIHEQSKLSILVSDTEAEIKVNGEQLNMIRTMRSGSIKNPKTTYVYEFDIDQEDFTVEIAGGPSWYFNVSTDTNPLLDIITVNIGDNEDNNSIGIDYYTKDDVGVEGGTVTLKPTDAPENEGEGNDEAKPLPSSKFNPITIRPN